VLARSVLLHAGCLLGLLVAPEDGNIAILRSICKLLPHHMESDYFDLLVLLSYMIWRIDPLLSSDYKQRSFMSNDWVNTFPLLDCRFLIMQQLEYNNGYGVFSM
jgi:hypothetical protein